MTDRLQPQFTAVLTLIKTAQSRVIATTNQELIQLYWSIGQYISDRLKTTEWGQKTIEQLATFIQTQEPGIKGFERRSLYRMRQFYETYPDFPIVSALLTQLSWTHHHILMSRCKTEEERLFYLQLAATERYSTRELDAFSPLASPTIFDLGMTPYRELTVSPNCFKICNTLAKSSPRSISNTSDCPYCGLGPNASFKNVKLLPFVTRP
jgi:predicted nuclease of restriction endonuclease-like (RecB) superfamily